MFKMTNDDLKNRLTHVLNYMEASIALLERENNTSLFAAQQVLFDGFELLDATIGMIYEGEKPDEMTTDEKEKLCRLVEEHLQLSICYDSCEPWKKGILKIAEELK
jgi:hypothetical protein